MQANFTMKTNEVLWKQAYTENMDSPNLIT